MVNRFGGARNRCKMRRMQTIPAHFDGQHILLGEAVELEPNTKLLVTVLPKDEEAAAWYSRSIRGLQRAYGVTKTSTLQI